jgi:biotin transport system substrate-specific component
MEAINSIKLDKIFKTAVVVILGSVLLTISAKIKIPFYPVPMTMQTFVVLLIGVSCGYKLGLTIVTVYLLEGLFGLPVFANSPEKGVGLIYFTGPTMGYLIGFLFSVFFAGYFKYENFFINLLKLIFSVSFIYILGLFWLGILVGWEKPLFKIGAQPFLLAELFKILILVFLIPSINKISVLKKII